MGGRLDRGGAPEGGVAGDNLWDGVRDYHNSVEVQIFKAQS